MSKSFRMSGWMNNVHKINLLLHILFILNTWYKSIWVLQTETYWYGFFSTRPYRKRCYKLDDLRTPDMYTKFRRKLSGFKTGFQ